MSGLRVSMVGQASAPDNVHESLEESRHKLVALRSVTRQNYTLDRRQAFDEVVVFVVVCNVGDSLRGRSLGLRLGLRRIIALVLRWL